MKTIKFVTQRRGFFNHLENSKVGKVVFTFLESSFEVPSFKRAVGSKIIRSRVSDDLGVIQRINYAKDENDDVIIGSFNRFLKTEQKYLIYLENPTALFHYSLKRNKTFLGKKRFQSYLDDPKLNYFICMSYACKNTLDKVFSPSKSNVKSRVIYPLVRDNKLASLETIKKKINRTYALKILFVAQGSRFVSKGGVEVIEVLKKLENYNVKGTIITNINKLNANSLRMIKECSNINVVDFNLSYDEMEKVYFNHDVLVHPSSDDSSPLTILEAMKSGLPIICTNLYALPEMVSEGENGFMIDPKWPFFDRKCLPNKEVWNNRKKTLHSEKPSDEVISFLTDKIKFFLENPCELNKMSINSYLKASKEPFSESFIMEEWNKVYNNIRDNY